MVQDLDEVLDIGELEDGQPSTLEVSQLIVGDQEEADEQVGCSEASQTDEGFLADATPRGMTDAQEDWLK